MSFISVQKDSVSCSFVSAQTMKFIMVPTRSWPITKDLTSCQQHFNESTFIICSKAWYHGKFHVLMSYSLLFTVNFDSIYYTETPRDIHIMPDITWGDSVLSITYYYSFTTESRSWTWQGYFPNICCYLYKGVDFMRCLCFVEMQCGHFFNVHTILTMYLQNDPFLQLCHMQINNGWSMFCLSFLLDISRLNFTWY